MIRTLGTKIISAVGLATVLSLLALWLFYNYQQEKAILAQNERTAQKLTESIIRGLEIVMLSGHAEVVQSFADQLKTVPGIVDFRVLRIDGNEALRDNRTIEDVNRRLGGAPFKPREQELVTPVLPAAHPELQRAIAKEGVVMYYDRSATGEEFLTLLHPLLNREKCRVCHGQANPVRGVLKLTTSLAPAEQDIRATRMQSILIVLAAILSIVYFTHKLISRTVVARVSGVTGAMMEVAGGNLTQKIPEAGRDELSQMAQSFNKMTDQLLATYTGLHREQDKLTTIIQSAREGIVVTDSAGGIVLVNPAAQQLLGKPADQIVREGFGRVLDNPEQMALWLASEGAMFVEVSYKGKMFQVFLSTIRAPDKHVVGTAVLLRDVTEEKRLEEELRKLSTTDALTGLWNRRYLDQTLAREWDRARRSNTPLGVIMIDIDHFKRFNDEHGHEVGDEILRKVATVVQTTVREIDVACRYGGEEITVVLPNTDLQGTMALAERIRVAIAECTLRELRVTASFGATAFPSFQTGSPEGLLEAADAALYRAKEGGRNCVRSSPAVEPVAT